MRCLITRILPRSLIYISFASTDHIAEATQHLKAFLGEYYNYSDKSMLKMLWETYDSCQFIDNEGKTILPLVLKNLLTDSYSRRGPVLPQ